MESYTNRGLSLIELLSVLVILGILAAMALPLFARLTADNAMTAAVNEFIGQLHLARSTAVARERRVTLCPSENGAQCADDYRQWNQGYMTFMDQNANVERDAGETILSVHQRQASAEIHIFSSSNQRQRITFLPMGRAWLSNTTFRFCDPDFPDFNRAVVLSNNGRVRVERRMPDDQPIVCE